LQVGRQFFFRRDDGVHEADACMACVAHAFAGKSNSAFFKWFPACACGRVAMRMPLPGAHGVALRGDGRGSGAVLREKICVRVVDSKKNRD
jgi:hypothetical protein